MIIGPPQGKLQMAESLKRKLEINLLACASFGEVLKSAFPAVEAWKINQFADHLAGAINYDIAQLIEQIANMPDEQTNYFAPAPAPPAPAITIEMLADADLQVSKYDEDLRGFESSFQQLPEEQRGLMVMLRRMITEQLSRATDYRDHLQKRFDEQSHQENSPKP